MIVTTPYGADLYVQTRTTLPILKLLDDLGFEYPAELESIDPDAAGEVILSTEQFGLLDSDWIIVLFYSTRTAKWIALFSSRFSRTRCGLDCQRSKLATSSSWTPISTSPHP